MTRWDEPDADPLGDIQGMIRAGYKDLNNPILRESGRKIAEMFGVDIDAEEETTA